VLSRDVDLADVQLDLYFELAAEAYAQSPQPQPVYYMGGAVAPGVTNADFHAGAIAPRPEADSGRMSLPLEAIYKLAEMSRPRLRYLPMPRLRIYRPLNAGRSSRGRRVRSSSSASRGSPRKPGGSDDPHPCPDDVDLPRAA